MVKLPQSGYSIQFVTEPSDLRCLIIKSHPSPHTCAKRTQLTQSHHSPMCNLLQNDELWGIPGQPNDSAEVTISNTL